MNKPSADLTASPDILLFVVLAFAVVGGMLCKSDKPSNIIIILAFAKLVAHTFEKGCTATRAALPWATTLDGRARYQAQAQWMAPPPSLNPRPELTQCVVSNRN